MSDANVAVGGSDDELANASDENEGDSETYRERKKRDVLSYLEWAGLALCILLVLVAGLRVYMGVGAFISLWVASKYEPIVSAGFNLAVLLVAAYGAAILSRRLTDSS